MNFRKISFWVLSCVFSISMAGCKSGKSNNQNEAITDSVWTKSKVIETIKKVNDYWQAENPEPAFAFWHPAAYHTGNIAAYEVTGNETYKKYSEAWLKRINGKELLLMINPSGNIIMVKRWNMFSLEIGRFVSRLILTCITWTVSRQSIK